MSTVLTIVRLRWALTWAAMRKSPWQTVGYVVSAVFALGGVVGLTAAAVFLGGGPATLGVEAAMLGRIPRIAMAFVGVFVTLFVVVIQVMIIGEGSTMAPGRFALYGIPDRTLQAGLLLAGLSGLPAIAGTVALALWSLAYRWMGPAPVIAAIVAAPLAVVTLMSLSKLVISLATLLVATSRGRNVFYVVSIMVFVLLCQVPNLVVNSGVIDGFGAADYFALFTPIADVLAWTPLSAAFQLPFDALAGAWLPFAGRVAVLAATWVVCFLLGVWCLRRERLVAGRTAGSGKTKGIGAFGWIPDSPSGAISARLVIYLRRDARQSVFYLMPLVLVVLFAMQSHGISAVVWQSLTWMGLFMLMCEANGLAYDGGGFVMQVLAGTRGRDDRRGRVRVYGAFATVYLVALAAVIFAVTGDWRTADGLALGLMCTLIGLGVCFAALGLAEVLSCVLMYPVPSIDRPFSSPQGRAVAQGFFPFVHILGSVLLMLPTGIVAIAVALTAGSAVLMWAAGPVALANGLAALALGVWLGGRLLDARETAIVRILDSFASLQK